MNQSLAPGKDMTGNLRVFGVSVIRRQKAPAQWSSCNWSKLPSECDPIETQPQKASGREQAQLPAASADEEEELPTSSDL